jgi:acyl carrier protein
MDGRLKALLADVLQLSEARVAQDLAMKDVETWDSLKHMELVAAIERAYGLELTFEEIVGMQTVAEIRRVLSARGVGS